MKKILAFILAATLAVSFAGCGDKKEDKKTPNGNDVTATDNVNTDEGEKKDTINTDEQNGAEDTNSGDPEGTTEPLPEDGTNTEVPDNGTEVPDDNGEKPVEQPGNEQMPSDDKKPADEKKPSEETKPDDQPVPEIDDGTGMKLPSISKQTLVDTDVCRFTVTGIKNDSFFGPTLMCELENKSKDVSYIFSIKDSYVNGVYTPMYLYSEVAPGKKSNEEISLSLDELRMYGLTKITNIEINLEVKDSNASWIDPPAVLQTVSLQPYGKNQAKNFVLGAEHIKNVYIDNKYAKVSALSYYKNDMYGYCIDLFIENKSNSNIAVKFENTMVNGKLLDPYVYEVVNSGKNVIARVDWPASEFEAHGFTTFNEIKFTLVVSNNDDLSAKSFSSDDIVLSFG